MEQQRDQSAETCFVIMPFGEEFAAIYEDVIVPSIRSVNLHPFRADDIFSKVGPVISGIWGAIRDARIVIADLSGRNPNVFYELGLAHGIGRKVLLLSQDIDDVPFDLSHLRVWRRLFMRHRHQRCLRNQNRKHFSY